MYVGNSEYEEGGTEGEEREGGAKRGTVAVLPQVRLVVTWLIDEGAISGLEVRA